MTDHVIFAEQGQLGLITLNRPKALHALTLPMILAMQKQLKQWKEQESIKAVVLQAVPGNAFCAGGDIRWLYDMGKENPKEQMQFFWHEYQLNYLIHHLGKPYIALMDGLTMGGGVGVSLHGSHPVATEQFVFAMPETSIGFFPDIGASYLLARCPGYLGMYLGLTGNRLGAEDALRAKLIKHTVASQQLPLLLEALQAKDLSVNAHEAVTECLKSFVSPISEGSSQIKPLINVCFSQPSLQLILTALADSTGAWAENIYNTLRQKSPISLQVTFEQLGRAKGLSLAQCLKMDFNLVNHFVKGRDFYEGVRALLIDKDKKPIWKPSDLNQVSDRMVQEYFEKADKGLEL